MPCIELQGIGQQDREPYIQVEVYGLRITALLDTGSSVTIMGAVASEHIAEANETQVRPSQQVLYFADGSNCFNAWEARVPVKYRRGSVSMTVIMLPSLSHQAILGRDFINAVDLVMDLRHGFYTFGQRLRRYQFEPRPAAGAQLQVVQNQHAAPAFVAGNAGNNSGVLAAQNGPMGGPNGPLPLQNAPPAFQNVPVHFQNAPMPMQNGPSASQNGHAQFQGGQMQMDPMGSQNGGIPNPPAASQNGPVQFPLNPIPMHPPISSQNGPVQFQIGPMPGAPFAPQNGQAQIPNAPLQFQQQGPMPMQNGALAPQGGHGQYQNGPGQNYAMLIQAQSQPMNGPNGSAQGGNMTYLAINQSPNQAGVQPPPILLSYPSAYFPMLYFNQGRLGAVVIDGMSEIARNAAMGLYPVTAGQPLAQPNPGIPSGTPWTSAAAPIAQNQQQT